MRATGRVLVVVLSNLGTLLSAQLYAETVHSCSTSYRPVTPARSAQLGRTNATLTFYCVLESGRYQLLNYEG
jgi:hypothetical protein